MTTLVMFWVNLSKKRQLLYLLELLRYVKTYDGISSAFLCYHDESSIGYENYCWKHLAIIKKNRYSEYLMRHVKGKLNCNCICFYNDNDRVKFLMECIKKLDPDLKLAKEVLDLKFIALTESLNLKELLQIN